ncbi:hypothetical protein [Deinococcus ruber]|uniref:hypothetical protein n=1 Tax=Deinococcus ruber TaxID=1848197 RepID=UPI001E35A898|nr:hypothetical protein [Deinococcus ruber]
MYYRLAHLLAASHTVWLYDPPGHGLCRQGTSTTPTIPMAPSGLRPNHLFQLMVSVQPGYCRGSTRRSSRQGRRRGEGRNRGGIRRDTKTFTYTLP